MVIPAIRNIANLVTGCSEYAEMQRELKELRRLHRDSLVQNVPTMHLDPGINQEPYVAAVPTLPHLQQNFGNNDTMPHDSDILTLGSQALGSVVLSADRVAHLFSL